MRTTAATRAKKTTAKKLDLRAALRELGGNGGFIVRTFDLVEVAEEEIAKAKERGPKEEADRVHAAFQVLWPGAIRNYSDDVYRVHVRELIERVRRGQDTRPGTKAEVLCAMLETSLKAPLRSSGQALAERLFRDLFPAASLGSDYLEREDWVGQIAEDLAEARRKLAVADRTMKG